MESTADAGTRALLPDLTIDEEYLASSLHLTGRTITEGSCELVERCVGGTGLRSLLQFGMRTPNEGPGDLVLGRPQGNPLFEFSSCHQHYHFTGYARFRLLDLTGEPVTEGMKQSFALMDVEPNDGGAEPTGRRFHSTYQGISAGWADVYGAGTDCQWLDVTDVVPGEYMLEAIVNPDGTVDEADMTNNGVRVPVTVPANTCPGGCAAWNENCCVDGDPCGLNTDGVCNCGGVFAWDEAECASCVSDSPDCSAPWPCSERFCENGDTLRQCDEGVSCLDDQNRRRTCEADSDCRPFGDQSCPPDFCVDGDSHRFCDRGQSCQGDDDLRWTTCPDDEDCPVQLEWRTCPDRFCESDDPDRYCDEGTTCEDGSGHVQRCADDADCR